jgi:sodium transport system permease protein
MNFKSIVTVYLKELKEALRDRRTLISTIVIPTVAMPVLFFGATFIMSKIVKKARNEASPIALVGGADSPAVVAALKAEPRFRVVEVGEDADYKELVSDKKLRVAVGIPDGFEASLKEGAPKTVTLYYYQGEMKSGMGTSDVERFFADLRNKTVETRLTDRGLPAELVKPFEVKRQNVAPPEKVGGNFFGGIIPYLMIILCFTGAMYPAIDLTAGEKERGTMETLMCSPVKRINIVLGKFLLVMTASVATIVFSLVSMGGSLLFGGSLLGGGAASSAATKAQATSGFIPLIDPAGIVGVFAMIVPMAVLFAALLLTISLAAKNYKEAQSYVSPLIMVVIIPAMFGMLPGVELSLKTAMVPILNISLVSKEMLSGVWNWGPIAVIFGSTSLYAALALMWCVRMFNREDVMFRA